MSDPERTSIFAGLNSSRPSSHFTPGTAAWHGALLRESNEQAVRARADQARADQARRAYASASSNAGRQSNGGTDGGLLAALGFLIIGGAVLHGLSSGNVRSGMNLRVESCQFTGKRPENSHVLRENEWVHIENVYGDEAEVSAYRRPYDGTSVRGTLKQSCLRIRSQ